MARDVVDCDFGCGDHAAHPGVPGHKGYMNHPDAMHVPRAVGPHGRGARPPQKHSRGKMPSQMNPDHGPHR